MGVFVGFVFLFFFFVYVYLSLCQDVVVAILGVVGDYSKFGLLSYISRGKQPHIQQLAQYHSNNTELSPRNTLPQILISAHTGTCHKIWNSLQKLKTPGGGIRKIHIWKHPYSVKIRMSGNIWYLCILETNLCRLQKPHILHLCCLTSLFSLYCVFLLHLKLRLIVIVSTDLIPKPQSQSQSKHFCQFMFDPLFHKDQFQQMKIFIKKKNYFCRTKVCKTLSSAFLSILWV